MEDIFQWCREGIAMQVRVWLDDTEHDMNHGDDHGFSPLHWAAKEGHLKIVEMLVQRGARINSTNRGDDTPLHLAAAHGHHEIVHLLLKNRADINFTNEHGNTPLHYACFWGYEAIAEELIENGALAALANKDGDTPLDKGKGPILKHLKDLALQSGQDLTKINFKDQSWLGLKTRSSKIFSHPNVLPVIGCCNSPPNLVVISQYMPWGSLHTLLHEGARVTVDTALALRLAVDVSRAMAFLHSLERSIPQFHLNSHHIMIDEDLTARINMADAKFSFQEKARVYYPGWMSPEALHKKRIDTNSEACDMWSFSILLWELATREIPFSHLSPMEIGMKVALEGLRVSIPSDISPHLTKLIKICMNEDPGKRPTFDMVLPILDKMKR
ncbi:PREDICTED: integrin-linked protein kinase-like [Diuraphis noxia]|uniref:integrin-linked protein kinase-like n=1 Tax=Diuraphis noxia TaxID=143948 RepID=UPI000763B1E6|nr:PREDICTED: integrin-linked protein kinase-like [Diuraphis noxia]